MKSEINNVQTYGGKREGAGRKINEVKVVKSWRVNKNAVETLRKHKIDISEDINKLVKRKANEINKSQGLQKESLQIKT